MDGIIKDEIQEKIDKLKKQQYIERRKLINSKLQ